MSRFLPCTSLSFLGLPDSLTKIGGLLLFPNDWRINESLMETNFIENINFSPQMIGQQLAKVLMDAIVTNEIRGGEKLVELQLQKKFGVSRSPIREAIRDLEKMGLVEIIPRKGTIVKKITKKNIREDIVVRAPLEGLAAKEAYANMNTKEHARLARALERMRAAVKGKDVAAYWRAHADFHNIFINSSGNGLLVVILRSLRIHSLRAQLVYPNPNENWKGLLATHEKILNMFTSTATDPERLGKFVTQHILDYLPNFLANIEKAEA